jgi:2-oxoglutarate ferredoxin oxidoreductase subunit beta
MAEINIQDIIKPENLVYKKTRMMTDKTLSYCPGCGHGTAHRLIMEVIEEMGKEFDTIGVAPVGCSVLAYEFMNIDMQEAAHGRAPAVATGIKRARPELVVFSYQGDGDLASIGMGEIVHAANRGEKFTTIFVNNAIYGMTGGQMAPTTMANQITTTCPRGRDVAEVGQPIRMAELLSSLVTPAYIARVAVSNPRQIIQAKKAIKQAFTYQVENRCFSLVEILSTCPTNWGKTPADATRWVEETMKPYYPLGCMKDPGEGGA